MSNLLSSGQILNLQHGKNCEVISFIGAGGQGEVYEVSVNNKRYALKWYFPNQATDAQREGIEQLVKTGKPSNSFLWPIDLVFCNQSNGFGYIMDLRDSDFKSLIDLMKNKVDTDFQTLTKATFNLAHSFQQLHAQGLCYRDISHGNIFFHEKTGDILICDNDNVGLNNSDITGVLGTPRFMAPEIVRAEAKPNSDSDLFSLSTLIFYILFISHPLEGKNEADIRCFDQPAMDMLYGTNPVFIFDPNDSQNRPVPGYHKNALIYWDLYPDFIKDIFIRAFTVGLHPSKRVRTGEWKEALMQLRDSITLCKCGAENFAQIQKGTIQCWNCKSKIESMRLDFGKNFVALHPQTTLYKHHTDPSTDNPYDLSQVTACISQHPNNPEIWGLKNLSDNVWRAFSPQGDDMRPIEKEKSIVISPGTRIDFGRTEATIH